MYKISEELAKEIREAMKKEKNVLTYRRMEAAALRGDGKKNEEISRLRRR